MRSMSQVRGIARLQEEECQQFHDQGRAGKEQRDNRARKFVVADEDYLPTYGVNVVAGRGFSKTYGTDTSSFLINEAAVGILGLKSPQDAVGKQFQYGGRKGQLIGVFNDFHFESMHQRILPLVA